MNGINRRSSVYNTFNITRKDRNMSYPIHRLTQQQSAIWFLNNALTKEMINNLSHQYPDGVQVASVLLRIIARIKGNEVTRLTSPFVQVEMHEIANKPTSNECVCSEWYVPERREAWGVHNKGRHHPVCNFQEGAAARFNIMSAQSVNPRKAEKNDSFLKRLRNLV